LLNHYLKYVGLSPQGWLQDPLLVMPSIVIMSIWKGCGFYMVILLAGLYAIPAHYYEAAELDGASRLQQFLKITLPLLKPALMFCSIMGIITSFQIFDQVYIMTEGGPMNKSLVVTYYLWKKAFTDLNFGYATAIAWLIFGILTFLTVVQFKSYGKEVEY